MLPMTPWRPDPATCGCAEWGGSNVPGNSPCQPPHMHVFAWFASHRLAYQLYESTTYAIRFISNIAWARQAMAASSTAHRELIASRRFVRMIA